MAVLTVYSLNPPALILPSADDLVGPAAVAAFMGWPMAKTERALETGAIPCRRVDGVLTARRSRLRAIFGADTHARAA